MSNTDRAAVTLARRNLLARAAAIVAQVTDPDAPLPTHDVRRSMSDRYALLASHMRNTPAVDGCEVTLWDEHCLTHGLSTEHSLSDIVQQTIDRRNS